MTKMAYDMRYVHICAVHEAITRIRFIDLTSYIKWVFNRTKSLIFSPAILSSESGVISVRVSKTSAVVVYFVHLFGLINSQLLFASKLSDSGFRYFLQVSSRKNVYSYGIIRLIHFIGILFVLIF